MAQDNIHTSNIRLRLTMRIGKLHFRGRGLTYELSILIDFSYLSMSRLIVNLN